MLRDESKLRIKTSFSLPSPSEIKESPSVCFFHALKMDTVIYLLVLSTLPRLVVSDEFSHETSFRAVVEVGSGDSRIFSGESVRLKCSIPDIHKFSWHYLWFRGSEKLPQSREHLHLWKAKIQDSVKFYCQGVRDTKIGQIYTLLSMPLEIKVDGGWAILQVPRYPGLVGETLKVTCRIRFIPRRHKLSLYKDGFEVIRQNGLNPHFYLTNVTLEDQGMYTCRASWDADRRTHSVISVAASVQVSEVLSQPFLEIVEDNRLISVKKIKLVCHLQYNARAPAPPILFFFYKNGHRLGTAKSVNHDLFRWTPGQYSCKATVPKLGLSRESEPKSFGPVTGSQARIPVHPRSPRPLSPRISSPDLLLSPAAEPTAARPSPHQAPKQTAAPFNISMASGNMSGESGDMSEESGDMSGESGDMSGESGDMSRESDDSP